MDSEELDKLYQQAEIVLDLGGDELRVRAGDVSSELDRWLSERDHETFVFVPAHDPGGEKIRKKGSKLATAAGGRAGQLVAPGVEPTPGWFFPSLSRALARPIASAASVHSFFWGRTGSPLEVHRTSALGDGWFGSGDSWYRTALEGLADLGHTLLRVVARPRAVFELLGGRVRYALFAGLAFLALAVGRYVWIAESQPTEGVEAGASWLLHPALLPAIVLGLLLRARQSRHLPEQDDLTVVEVSSAWSRYAPELASTWTLSLAAVVVLRLAGALGAGNASFDLVEQCASSLVVCLWVLSAVAYSKDGDSLFGNAVSAFFYSLFAVFGLKLMLALAGLGTKILWSIVRGFAPDFPDSIVTAVNVLADVSAEGVFLALMLGYTWAMQREHFGRWASGELANS